MEWFGEKKKKEQKKKNQTERRKKNKKQTRFLDEGLLTAMSFSL